MRAAVAVENLTVERFADLVLPPGRLCHHAGADTAWGDWRLPGARHPAFRVQLAHANAANQMTPPLLSH